jgi:hypothetical protein
MLDLARRQGQAQHMKKINVLAILLGFALACPAVLNAAPAPWYQWRSKVTGDVACSQTPLGPGWARLAGPYRDARCELRMTAK